MIMSRRSALKMLGAAAGTMPVLKARTQEQFDIEIAKGPFEAQGSSLQAYSAPEWYRDAKFGIWAHWGPQSAPEMGDWYARNMYIEGSHQYQYHLKTYGHPSKFGFKDVIATWKGENLDPDYLIRLYKKAGARYFFSTAVHCDNFDMWNSSRHRWNAAQMGIKRDVVGAFGEAARNHGLKFGVSEHLWGSWNWWGVNKGSDKLGSYAGIPYDGINPANWDLYHEPHPVAAEPWAEIGNEPEAWKREWFLRVKELVDNYHPDLLYSDGPIPFGNWGRSLAAHYYNQSLGWHGGKMEAVYTCKRKSDCAVGTCVLDVERGVFDGFSPTPWQTDTCVGDWHYSKEVEYKTPKRVIDLLVDIVSRNGNLLLNFPLRTDGTLDARELKIIDEITKWMAINSEGIYATRPWKVYGTGPSTVTAGSHEFKETGGFNEQNRTDMTTADVRFTSKGTTLYAYIMGWPRHPVVLETLAVDGPHNPGKIQSVQLLGHGAPLSWKQSQAGLSVVMPSERPCDYAVALKIELT